MKGKEKEERKEKKGNGNGIEEQSRKKKRRKNTRKKLRENDSLKGTPSKLTLTPKKHKVLRERTGCSLRGTLDGVGNTAGHW